MRPVQMDELPSLEDYERQRADMRAQMIKLKEPRRVALGPNMTLLFENRDTVRYQIMEMVRAEHLKRAQDVQHEVDTYNELVPADGELSATLLIEYPTEQERDVRLTALKGLELGRIRLLVGALEPVPGRFDLRQVGEGRISAVHYIKFKLDERARDAFRREGLAGNVRFVCDHPAYPAETVLKPPAVEALAKDLG